MTVINVSKYQRNGPDNPKKSKQNNVLLDFLSKEINFSNGKLSDKQKDRFFFELSTLLRSRLDLKKALDLMSLEASKEKEIKIVRHIKEMVISGDSFSMAMQKTGKFSEYDFFTVQIGEETGNLSVVMNELAIYYNMKIAQRRKILAALTYPIIVLCTSAGAVFFMLQFVVPMFSDVFKRFGGKLPWMTQMVISTSAVLANVLPYLLVLLTILTYLLFRVRHLAAYRSISSAIILKIPVVGELVKKIYLARFCNTMKLLVSTKIPLLRAIELTEKTISFFPIETSLMHVKKGILIGRPLNECLSEFCIYPQKIVQLIKIGEEINQLDYFFENISQQYVNEVTHQTDTLSKLIEPLIIIFLGLVVGFILVSMYLPMFQMSNSF